MGYMGFGMRKEVYTRKPKTSFAKIKEIYGDHMEDFKIKKNVGSKWSEKDKKEFKKFISARIRKEKISEDLYNYIAVVLVLCIVGLAIYLGLNMLG